MRHSRSLFLSFLLLWGCTLQSLVAGAQEEPLPLEPSQQLTADQLTDPMQAEDAITLVFDLYVGGVYQGDVVVTYTSTLLTLHDPRDALAMIPNLRDAQAVLPLLSNPIETERTVPGIGRLKVNRELFRIEIYLEPHLLTVKKIDVSEKDLEPVNKFTVRSDFKATGSSNFDQNPTRLSIFHRTRPSFGRNHIDWQGTMNRGQGYDLTDLALAHETGHITYRAGLLQTDGQRFAASRNFTGFEAGTTEKTLFGNPLLEGTRLEVFVPEAAKVDIYRGDQIIFSRVLEFGLQEIDTSRFPNGSYDVEIVITDRQGVETRERRLFTRTRTLTPFGKPRWLVQAGVLRDNIDATETPVFDASYSERVNDFMELGGSIYGSDNLSILQGSLKGIWGDNKFESDLSLSAGSDVGLYSQWERSYSWGSTFLSYNKTLIGHDDEGSRDPSVFDPLTSKTDALNFALNTHVDRTSISFRANRNRSSNGVTTYSYGPQVRHPIFNSRPHRLDLNLDWINTDSGSNAGAFLRYSYIPQGRWNYTSNVGIRRSNGQNDFTLTNAAQLSKQPGFQTGWQGTVQNSVRKNNNTESMTTSANVEYTSNETKLNLSGRATQNGGGNNNQSLSLEGYSAVFYADGKLALAATRGRDGSVLVAELTGSAKGQPMRIVANGRTIGVARVGERVAIFLEPFRTYTFSLETQKKDDLVSFSSDQFVVTLYPGNVTTRQWIVNKAILAFGRLVDTQGNPISWKRIAGIRDKNSLTDGFGYFSVEFTGREMPYIASEQNRCTFALPHVAQETEYFINVGDVLCL